MTTTQFIDRLAMLQKLGLADHAQMERLASETMATAKIACLAAVTAKKILKDDMDDVVQNATIKALGYLSTWDPGKASWKTFVSVVTASCIADQGRLSLRQAQIASGLAELQDQEREHDN